MEKKKSSKKVRKSKEWKPSPKQICVAQMLVNPEDKRTKEQKAQEAGITYKTLWGWMKDKRFIDYLNSLIDRYTDSELTEVWKSLLRQCKLGNIAAIKLFFDMKRMNPELNDKRELERARLEIERQKLAILEAKAGGGGDDIPDDGFLEALEAKIPDIWGGEEPCP